MRPELALHRTAHVIQEDPDTFTPMTGETMTTRLVCGGRRILGQQLEGAAFMRFHRCRSGVLALAAWSILLGCATPGSSKESSQARIDELERENEALVGRLATLENVLSIMGVKQTICRFDFVDQPSIDAVVLDIDEALGIVSLDKGRRDGVKEGYHFDVFLGTQYKGHVRVQDVEEAQCSAIIVNALSAIARGDSATTCL